MKRQWKFDLVERPFCEPLKAMSWEWSESKANCPMTCSLIGWAHGSGSLMGKNEWDYDAAHPFCQQIAAMGLWRMGNEAEGLMTGHRVLCDRVPELDLGRNKR